MRRSMLLRVGTLALGYAHTFPATKHLAAFARDPSLGEGWKGFGALFAVCLYLLPIHVQARGLRALWRRRHVLSAVTWTLAAVHAVPLVDHLPRFVGAATWADGWRGIGSAIAVAWFLAPVSRQGALVAALARWADMSRAVLSRVRPSPSEA